MELIDELMEKLEIDKPTLKEMLQEISRAGIAIKLENGGVRFFEKHRSEVISSMWKIVRVAKILNDNNIEFNLDDLQIPRIKKQSKVN